MNFEDLIFVVLVFLLGIMIAAFYQSAVIFLITIIVVLLLAAQFPFPKYK